MNTHDDERLPGEDELAALYRKLPDKLPSTELDAAVLRAAAAAVRPLQPRRPRWPMAISTAATLVLAAGLAWHMRELPSANQPPALPVSNTVSPVATAATTTAAPVATPALPPPPSPMPVVPAIDQQRMLAPAKLSRRPNGEGTSLQQANHAATTKDTAEQPPRWSPPPVKANAPIEMASSNTAQEQVPVGTATLRQAIPATSADRVAIKAEPFASQASPALAPRLLNRPPATTPMPAPVAPMPAPVINETIPAAPAPDVMYRAPSSYSPSSSMPLPSAPAAPAPFAAASPPAPPAPPAMLGRQPSDPTARQFGDTPTQELARIRLLFSLERRDEARQRLAAFHHLHPDYPLPANLREQLPSP